MSRKLLASCIYIHMIYNQRMRLYDENRDCEKHGYVLFKHKENKKGEWWVCQSCLREQWKKASSRRRLDPVVQQYHKNYVKELNKIRKSLSVYLTMILLAANIKPE